MRACPAVCGLAQLARAMPVKWRRAWVRFPHSQTNMQHGLSMGEKADVAAELPVRIRSCCASFMKRGVFNALQEEEGSEGLLTAAG